jgi:HSP20 family protein
MMRYPATDIRETKDAYVLEAELPGIRKEDVDIEFQDNTLVLRGKVDRTTQQSDQPQAATPTESETTDAVNAAPSGETSVVQKDADTSKELTPHWWSNERITGSFSRSFTFPGGVQSDAIKAAYKDGVLSITVPKAQKASSRINID